MQPHQQIIITEKAELDDKLAKLTAFFDTATFSGLSDEEQTRLRRQAHIMWQYSDILGERMAAF